MTRLLLKFMAEEVSKIFRPEVFELRKLHQNHQIWALCKNVVIPLSGLRLKKISSTLITCVRNWNQQQTANITLNEMEKLLLVALLEEWSGQVWYQPKRAPGPIWTQIGIAISVDSSCSLKSNLHEKMMASFHLRSESLKRRVFLHGIVCSLSHPPLSFCPQNALLFKID